MAASWQGQALMIVPTYNERENLPALVGQLRALPGDVHVLLVDVNPPDATELIAHAIATNTNGM